MADKPSRGLVLYGDGLIPSIGPSHSHLHSLASKACCGFLSLPHSPPSESEEERIVREFSLLLDAYEAYADKGKENAAGSPGHAFPTISERFMGLKAAIVTNNSKLRTFTEKLGCAVLRHEQLKEARHDLDQEPPVENVCNDLLNLLGIQGGKVSATSPFDLAFVHIGAGECVEGTEEEVKTSGIEYVNGLVGRIMHLAQPGSEIGSRLLLSLVMSYGNVSAIDCSRYSVLTSKDGWNSDLSKLCRPRQSYTMRGESPRDDVRHHCPMLLAQWQDAVTRMDMTKLLSFEDFKECGGNLVIPADRMLHEIAFKQWKAPKYGA